MVRYVAAHESCVYRSAVVTAYHYLLESSANSAVQQTTTIVHKHAWLLAELRPIRIRSTHRCRIEDRPHLG